MSSRTYRYFTGEPLYAFGYGLSYTSFAYDGLKINRRIKAGDSVRVSVNVKNTGRRAGDEVVQVYVTDRNAPVPVAIRSLKGFKRVQLSSGETKTVDIALAPGAFSIINPNNERVILPGDYEISVGGGQPDSKAIGTSGNTLRATITLH
jgi:beta-glucosidase